MDFQHVMFIYIRTHYSALWDSFWFNHIRGARSVNVLHITMLPVSQYSQFTPHNTIFPISQCSPYHNVPTSYCSPYQNVPHITMFLVSQCSWYHNVPHTTMFPISQCSPYHFSPDVDSLVSFLQEFKEWNVCECLWDNICSKEQTQFNSSLPSLFIFYRK